MPVTADGIAIEIQAGSSVLKLKLRPGGPPPPLVRSRLQALETVYKRVEGVRSPEEIQAWRAAANLKRHFAELLSTCVTAWNLFADKETERRNDPLPVTVENIMLLDEDLLLVVLQRVVAHYKEARCQPSHN